ncbi:amidohydrolase family protein [Frankia sp. Cppng1_Ct_nod]|uniref:N-acyl-D-amino-acid deacylase family protein n=1 Tax=Frankia sp. Cppng1_Ct_nod TaxID=2897162 RepID=UPI001040F49A|nr:amidohydrolase family protein [Frankia sp. Cppng1_Ct_nod]
MHDIVIRGGQVVDGTGAPRRQADVAIDGGRVVAIGTVPDAGRRTIDADGLIVSPGFVDIHTHLDVQGFWDPTLSPSPLHGVTTVLGGNCGFTVAPLDDTAGDYLMRMLSRVEGMPLESLRAGVPWDWRTTAEFLDRLDGTLAVNAGFMVGHSAIRRVAMGPAATERPATEDELETMKQLLRAGIAAGGLGFSSTWSHSHSDADGRPVPSRAAPAEELFALAAVAGEFEGTSLEFLPVLPQRGGFSPEITDVMVGMSVTARRPLNWNILAVNAKTLPDALARLEVGDIARSRGGKVVALTMPDTPPARFSFRAGFVLDQVPGLHDFLFLPWEERLAILRDPDRRRELRRGAEEPSAFSHLVDWGSRHIIETFSPQTKQYAGREVREIAAEEGRDPFDVLMDIVVADELKTTFSNPYREARPEDWQARAQVWRDPRAVVGASDAGAHLDMVEFFGYSTMLLQHGVREQQVVTLEEAVRLITDVPARLYGLRDRGRLRVGGAADIVIFDAARIARQPTETRFDLPAGAGRLYGEADGIEHVLVNGVEIAHDGRFTGDFPGVILRSGRDTETPSLN